MFNRKVLFFLITFLLSGSLLFHVRSQSRDSILHILRSDKINDDKVKYDLLCSLASTAINPDTIIDYCDQAIRIAEDLGISPFQAYIYKGFGYLNAGKLGSAEEYFLKAADYYRASSNNSGLAAVYTYLAEAYNQQESYKNSRKYLNDAVQIFREEKDTLNLASALHNQGYTYYCLGQYDTALELFTETCNIYLSLDSITEYAYCLGNMGLVYSRISELQKAEKNLLRAMEILSEKGDERAITQYLIEYAGLQQMKGELRNAISSAVSGFNKASVYNLLEFKRDAALRLSDLYTSVGKFDSAFFYYKEFKIANDSIKSVENIQKMADLTTEFEVAKKQAEVDVLERNKLIQLIVIVSLVLIILLAIWIIVVYSSSLRKSKKFTAALDERRKLLEEQSVVLKLQSEELRQQKEEIISSINYAKYIQASILPEPEQLESLLGEHFVLYLPKDIVSGDFYWISEIENTTVIAVADCTGHGVPGAFMSMLGTALLNEIVNKEYITHPGVILRHLRKEVINSLQQKGERGGQKDGMDIAVCTIDTGNRTLQFAGANNPLYLVRNSELPAAGNLRCETGVKQILYEIKGDMMPIGISDRMDNFTMHELEIFTGDKVYLFTDGFPDQFGASLKKKFGYRRFRELLLSNNTLSMPDQSIALKSALDGWMGNETQIDDILVFGFRVG